MKSLVVLLSVLFLASCSPYRGFLESEFTLADESPLPVWIDPLPEGYSRDEVEIVLQYWSSPLDVNDTILMVKGTNGTLEKKTGKSEHHPEYWTWAQEDWPNRSHPGYVNVTIEGTTEIIEHKKMEPIFYISNDKAVHNTMRQSE